ncbi:MAG: protease pro-enzyme activation domain-containing protein, partial [Acidilobus sp.]
MAVRLGVLLLLVAFVLAIIAPAASAVAPPPTRAAYSNSSFSPLPGFRYLGEVSPNQPVFGVLYVPLRNVPLIFYYAQAVSTPGSPLYHRFLTRQEVARLFYPTDEFNKALDYLRDHGLRIIFTALDSIIVFEGPASAVESALGVRVGLFSNGTTTYYAETG